MKTGVAIPDDIVRDAIRLARKLGKPRRQICAAEDSNLDPAVAEAARRVLRETEW